MKYFCCVTRFRKVILTLYFVPFVPNGWRCHFLAGELKPFTTLVCKWFGFIAGQKSPEGSQHLQKILSAFKVTFHLDPESDSYFYSPFPFFSAASFQSFSLTSILCFSWSRWHRSQVCLGQLGGQRFLLPSRRSPSSCDSVQDAAVSQGHHRARHGEDAAAKTFGPGSQRTDGFQIPARWKGYVPVFWKASSGAELVLITNSSLISKNSTTLLLQTRFLFLKITLVNLLSLSMCISRVTVNNIRLVSDVMSELFFFKCILLQLEATSVSFRKFLY